MIVKVLIAICTGLSLLKVSKAVFFTQSGHITSIPLQTPPLTNVSRIYAVPDNLTETNGQPLSCTLSYARSPDQPPMTLADPGYKDMFEIIDGVTRTTKWLNHSNVIKNNLPHRLLLQISCHCSYCQSESLTNSTEIAIHVLDDNDGFHGNLDQFLDALSATKSVLEIHENLGSFLIGSAIGIPYSLLPDMQQFGIQLTGSGAEYVEIDPVDYSLMLVKSLDREQVQKLDLTMAYTLQNREELSNIVLLVRDVNDNGPYITHNGQPVKEENIEIILDKTNRKKSSWLSPHAYHVVDMDANSTNQITSYIEGKYADHFHLQRSSVFKYGKHGQMYIYMLYIETDIDLNELSECSTQLKLVLLDKTLLVPHTQWEKLHKAVYYVTLRSSKDCTYTENSVNTDVESNPTAHTRHGHSLLSTAEQSINSETESGTQAIYTAESLPDNNERKVEFLGPVHVKRAHKTKIVAHLSRSASPYSRVVTMKPLTGSWTYSIQQNALLATRVLAITEYDGIIYVRGDSMLRKLTSSDLEFDVIASEVNTGIIEKIHLVVIVSILHSNRGCYNFPDSCSLHRSKEQCESSCALGVREGSCEWRQNNLTESVQSPWYSTCTSSLATCPDQKCDSLERQHPSLCPQDCTAEGFIKLILEHVTGNFMQITGSHRPHGIARGQGACWCNKNAECTCMSTGLMGTNTANLELLPTRNTYNRKDTKNKKTENQILLNAKNLSHTEPVVQHERYLLCDQSCTIIIASSLCVAALLVPILIIVCVLWRKHRRREIKHVASIMSLSIVPSDYIEDRQYSAQSIEYSTSSIDHQSSPRITNRYTTLRLDKKWEFSRKRLQLGDVIGEGEFGKVVTATAYNIAGNDRATTVAVKMLKDGASNAEFRDLISEYNLLKDVNHPNVIKLLGACTQGGPLYVIVEFCEHGCLRSYLRHVRNHGTLINETINKDERAMSSIDPNVQYTLLDHHEEEEEEEEEEKEEEKITDEVDEKSIKAKDLMSFSWQIAKGMQYLSEMKLVHRDLAARNILVASDKVIKISDFGLSRDIYEGDAYKKKSKGRIPVKWMAPESLYDQTYTSKSDVWSFGVVLWEIVTLGATPYPGLPPEKLYNLLCAGYRMEKPINCSDRLYTIIKSCWERIPVHRPSFKNLAHQFDKLLAENIDYLDLKSIAEMESDEVTSNKQRYEQFLQGTDDKQQQHDNMYVSTPVPVDTPHEANKFSLQSDCETEGEDSKLLHVTVENSYQIPSCHLDCKQTMI